MIKGVVIFGAGVGAGFAIGYVKAGYDLDREAIQELNKIGKEFFVDARKAIRENVEETRLQTVAFHEAAEAIRQKAEAEKETNTPEVDEPEVVDDPEEGPTP